MNRNFGFNIVCVFHELTGYLCPGCGITRCLFSILRLDFKSAFFYNKLVFILLPFFIIYYCLNLYNYVFDKKYKEPPQFVVIILLIVTIVFGVVRNII